MGPTLVCSIAIFHDYIFIIRLTHANVWESMGKPCSCMQFIVFFTASLAKIRISTTNHVRIRIKSHVLHMNVQ